MPNRSRASRPRRNTREAALGAAAAVFVERGFDDTSMDAVSARAGVSKATLYAHYGDKVGLFTAFMDRARELDLALDRSLDGATLEDRLTSLVTAIIEATTSDVHIAYLRMVVHEAHRSSPRYVREAGPPHGIDVAEELIRTELAASGRDVTTAPELAAFFVRMAVAPLQLDVLLSPDFQPSMELVQLQARWAAQVFLASVGLGTPSTEPPGRPPGGFTYPWIKGYP